MMFPFLLAMRGHRLMYYNTGSQYCNKNSKTDQSFHWLLYDSIDVYHNIIFAAKRSNKSGPVRLWQFARHLDPDGSGWIFRNDLRAFCVFGGMPEGTFRRLLAAAKQFGFMEQIKRWDGSTILRLAGAERVAAKVGTKHVGNRRASIPVELLFKQDWIAYVWAGFIATLNGKPISRSRMREITGVAERTQQDYESKAGIIQKANYAHDETRGAGDLPIEREYGRKRSFLWFDRKLNKKILAHRMPDSRSVSKRLGITCGGRARTTRINKALGANSPFIGNYCDDFIIWRVAAHVPNFIRIYHESQKHAQSMARKINDLHTEKDTLNDRFREVFHHKPGGRNVNQWCVVNV